VGAKTIDEPSFVLSAEIKAPIVKKEMIIISESGKKLGFIISFWNKEMMEELSVAAKIKGSTKQFELHKEILKVFIGN
jgi:hypothetical protein